MVQSRKRKVTKPEHRGQDRLRDSDRQGGAARVYGQHGWQGSGRFSTTTNSRSRHSDEGRDDQRFSNFLGIRVSSSEWHGSHTTRSDGNMEARHRSTLQTFRITRPCSD